MATIQGGKKLEAYLRQLSKQVATGAKLRVGFLEDAAYPGTGTSVAMVAAIQNFGAPKAKIPPRPFFSNMVKDHRAEWGPTLGRYLPARDYDAGQALALLGEDMKGELRQAIIDTHDPPLSPITLMLRKMFGNHPEEIRGRDVGIAAAKVAAGEDYGGASTKPLEWTGFMLGSVGSEVT